MSIRIGTSGWVYPHWRGVFYPENLPQRGWLGRYAESFDTVEINNSFYRLPSAETFDRWCSHAPRGFCYSVKASRYITHMKKLKDPREPLRLFFQVAARLGNKLGPALYQLPPHWRVDLGRFEEFLDALPKRHQHVIEFRDSSWLIDEVFGLMTAHGVSHCIHDMRGLEIPIRVTGEFAYIRFHGDESHSGDYPRSRLRTWARRLVEWQREGLDSFVYFNNDVGGHAIKNALTLKGMVAKLS